MSQIGFILTGCSMQCLLGEENGLAVSGTVLHMVNHSMIKLVLFMAAGCIYMNLHKLDLNEIRGYGRNKPFLMLVFAMGAYGICGIPLWNGYVSKTLLHESIVEYMEMLGRQGANVLPFQVLEWAFLMAGGLTAAYMIKLFAAIFLEKAPLGRDGDDRGKKYAGTAACFALGGSALFLPLMGMAPRRIMDWMADISRSFLGGRMSCIRWSIFQRPTSEGPVSAFPWESWCMCCLSADTLWRQGRTGPGSMWTDGRHG